MSVLIVIVDEVAEPCKAERWLVVWCYKSYVCIIDHEVQSISEGSDCK